MWCSSQQPRDTALLIQNCSSFDAFLTVKGDRSNKLIAATTVGASHLTKNVKGMHFKMGLDIKQD